MTRRGFLATVQMAVVAAVLSRVLPGIAPGTMDAPLPALIKMDGWSSAGDGLRVGDIVTIEGSNTPYRVNPVTREVDEPRTLQQFRVTSTYAGTEC